MAAVHFPLHVIDMDTLDTRKLRLIGDDPCNRRCNRRRFIFTFSGGAADELAVHYRQHELHLGGCKIEAPPSYPVAAITPLFKAPRLRDLLSFLAMDCCRGNPEVCEPLIESALAECC